MAAIALLAGQKSGMVHAIDPDRAGEVFWKVRAGRGGIVGGIDWGPAADEKNVYVAISDIPSAEKSIPRLAPAYSPCSLPIDDNSGGRIRFLVRQEGPDAPPLAVD